MFEPAAKSGHGREGVYIPSLLEPSESVTKIPWSERCEYKLPVVIEDVLSYQCKKKFEGILEPG